MQEQYYLENIEQIQAIAEPTRWRMLDMLTTKSMTGAQLARALQIPRPRAHYHLKILEKVGLVQFEEERISNGMVEKYYRAMAQQCRIDRLVDRVRLASAQNGAAQETGKAVRDLMLSVLEVARADILQPDALPGLVQAGFVFLVDLHLTSEQATTLIHEWRRLGEQYAEFDRQNHERAGNSPLTHLRFTWLLTPAAALGFDTESNSEGHAEVAENAKTVGQRPQPLPSAGSTLDPLKG